MDSFCVQQGTATNLPIYSFITQNITEPKRAMLVALAKIKRNFGLLDGLKMFGNPPPPPSPKVKGVSSSAQGPDAAFYVVATGGLPPRIKRLICSSDCTPASDHNVEV
jgi:hypothetical protein